MMMKRIASLPEPMRRALDRLGPLLGQRDELTPPQWMFHDPDRVDGSHDVREFISIGETTVAWFIDQGLRPTDRVLDLGCGIGRMALPLTKYLAGGGTYDGIEIARYKVDYCQRTVGNHYPNFKFHHTNVFNKYYNPRGKVSAAEYRFPFANESFDFIFLVSVFSHMLPADMENYLSEIARVMDKGATCITTYFLMDRKGQSPLSQFDYSDVCSIYRRDEPEHGVQYIESYVLGLYEKLGLNVRQVSHGRWIERPDSVPDRLQDIIIATKPG